MFTLVFFDHTFSDRWKAHVKELEEEVKLLQSLSHPNIVVRNLFNRYFVVIITSATCWTAGI
jgi:hypothetical protein